MFLGVMLKISKDDFFMANLDLQAFAVRGFSDMQFSQLDRKQKNMAAL